MSLKLAVQYATGKTVTAVVAQRVDYESDPDTIANKWNAVAAAWQAAPSFANQRISMTADSDTTDYYRGAIADSAGWNTYNGQIEIRYLDGSLLLAVEHVDVVGGNEIRDYHSYLSAINGWANIDEIHTWLSDGGRLDTQIDAAAAGGVEIHISPIAVSMARTFSLRKHGNTVSSHNVVTVGAGTAATFAMDFRSVLNDLGAAASSPETTILSVVSVQDTTGSPALTIASQSPSQSKLQVHFAIASGFIAGNSHRMKCVVLTTDQQTLVGYGTIRVE